MVPPSFNTFEGGERMDTFKIIMFIIMGLFLAGGIVFVLLSDKLINTGKKNKKADK